jgi:hypothetical protein
MTHVDEHRHALSFLRETEDSSSYAVVGLTIGHAHHFHIHGVQNGVYRDAVTGRQIKVHEHRIDFTVQANSAGIYVLNGPGQIGQAGPFLK